MKKKNEQQSYLQCGNVLWLFSVHLTYYAFQIDLDVDLNEWNERKKIKLDKLFLLPLTKRWTTRTKIIINLNRIRQSVALLEDTTCDCTKAHPFETTEWHYLSIHPMWYVFFIPPHYTYTLPITITLNTTILVK